VTFNKDCVQMCLNVFETFIQPANTHTHTHTQAHMNLSRHSLMLWFTVFLDCLHIFS